jgi:hypothetical protein
MLFLRATHPRHYIIHSIIRHLAECVGRTIRKSGVISKSSASSKATQQRINQANRRRNLRCRDKRAVTLVTTVPMSVPSMISATIVLMVRTAERCLHREVIWILATWMAPGPRALDHDWHVCRCTFMQIAGCESQCEWQRRGTGECMKVQCN